MSGFRRGSPQVLFKKRDGSSFAKTFHSRNSAAKAVRGYRAAGGHVVGRSVLGSNGWKIYGDGVRMKRGNAPRRSRYSSYK